MFLYISLLISYFRRVRLGHELLVGASVVVRWSGNTSDDTFTISFAPEPESEALFDDYGWSVDETFTYIPSLRNLLTFIHDSKRIGHRVRAVSLLSADSAD